MKRIIIFVIVSFFHISLSAQSPFPFGSAPISDLEMTEYERDKDASAVYLFDWCSTKLTAYNDLSLKVERHFRIKILKEDGLDLALIQLYTGEKSAIIKFSASTFNLEDGKIVEAPLTKKEIYTEKIGNHSQQSFAFTNVKVGSIIECSYTLNLNSIFFLYPWYFQHEIPVAYSEYNVTYPGLFRFKVDNHYNNLMINVSRNQQPLTIGSISTQELTYKWTVGNVPAFRPEPYMASENDLIARVEFELAGIDYPNYGYEEVTPTYEKLTQKLLDDENFGLPIERSAFLKKTVDEITAGLPNNVEKIKAIHRYITHNVKWNERMGIFTSESNFRKILSKQNGSVADINLLFVAMLGHAGVTSCPVVLSTRENGSLNPFYAIVTKFDYVVAYAKVGDKEYLMDATDEFRPFNELPSECLNGEGRTIHPRMSKWIPLKNNEQLYDQIIIDAELSANKELECNVQHFYGSYRAYSFRKMLHSTGKEGFIAMLNATGKNKEYSDVSIENQDSVSKSLTVKYKVKIKGAVQTTPELYVINPMLFFARTENPFSNSERKYPIDFNCPENEIYTLNIKIPENYVVDELPSELNLKLENNNAVFTYSPTVENNTISIRYRYSRKQTHFPVENYNGLKEFFTQFIKKQSDLIILKKNNTAIATNL